MKGGGAIFFALLLLIGLSECSKDKTNQCSTCSAVSFKSDIIPIFIANCALSGCHNVADNTNGHVGLDSADAYSSITKPGTGYIVAGNPAQSILLEQLYAGASNHMPNNGQQLDNCTIQKINCWIQQGAQNN